MQSRSRLFLSLTAVLAVILVLGSCEQVFDNSDDNGDSGDSDNSQPSTVLGTLEFSLVDSTKSPVTNSDGETSTAGIAFYVGLSSEVNYGDVESLTITDPAGTRLPEYGSAEITEAWSANLGAVVMGTFYSAGSPDSVALGDWTVEATTTGGVSESGIVTVVARGDPNHDSGKVYSENAGQTPPILTPPQNSTISAGSSSFTVTFDSTDSFVKNAFVGLYNSSTSPATYLGSTPWLAGDTAVSTNNNYTVDFTELEPASGEDPTEATHGVVWLYADSADVNGHYRSLSDYVPVN